MTTRRGRADAARARCCADPTSTRYDLDERAVTSSSAAARSRPGSRKRHAPASARSSRRATRAPRPASGSAPRSTIPDEDAVVSVGRPHASVDLAVLDDDDRPVRRGRGRRGVPALPRGDVGLLARPRGHRAPRSPPTASCAPATSAGSTTAAACGSSAAARRCTSAAATTCTRSRSKACCRRHPAVAAVAVVPRADPVMGEIGVAVVVPRDAGAPPTLAELRDARRARSPRTSCREALAAASTRCPSPRWRRSTGARSRDELDRRCQLTLDAPRQEPETRDGARVQRRPGRAARQHPRGARQGVPDRASRARSSRPDAAPTRSGRR